MSRGTQSATRRQRARNRRRVPDFARLYHGEWGVPPRSAYALWHYAGVLADLWQNETDVDTILLDDLPPCVRRHADLAWLHRFAQCFADIRGRLAGGMSGRLAQCTGDEMAVHLTIDFAAAEVRDGAFEADPAYCRLPWDRYDDDFEGLVDVLLEDIDVLMLFEPAFDGIENDDELQAEFGMAELHPLRWFEPFWPNEAATG